MAWMNISHFINTLPETYDTWNESIRIDYYNENLIGFSLLNETLQEHVVKW